MITTAGIINYAVYENGNEYLGMASVTMPTKTNKSLTVNGAGIAGDIDIPVPGHHDAATVTFTFLDSPEGAYKLSETRRHILDLRLAREVYDSQLGKIKVSSYKTVLEVIPRTHNQGSVAPASQQGASVECTLLSEKEYIDGKLVRNWDPVNFIDSGYSGTDVLAEVRSALGK